MQAVELLQDYCEQAPQEGDKPGFRGRAKLIVKANPLPSAFPSMLEGYNGKPVLITASGHVFAGGAPLASPSAFAQAAVALSGGWLVCEQRRVGAGTCASTATSATGTSSRASPYTPPGPHPHLTAARKASAESRARLRLDGVLRRDTVPTMSMELGLTIEARDDREMPERILGCAQFHKPSWDAATKVE